MRLADGEGDGAWRIHAAPAISSAGAISVRDKIAEVWGLSEGQRYAQTCFSFPGVAMKAAPGRSPSHSPLWPSHKLFVNNRSVLSIFAHVLPGVPALRTGPGNGTHVRYDDK